MIEHALREGLTLGETSKMCSETEGFSDGQVSLDHVKGSTSDLFFLAHDTSSLVEAVIDTTHGVDGSGNFSQEDRLLESRFSGKLACIVKSSGSWDDLTTTSVDSISMEDAINDVDSDTAHILFAENGLLGSPLPGRFH